MSNGSNSLETLRSAGVDVDKLPEGVQEVLSGLSSNEAQTLASVYGRLKGAVKPVAEHTGYFIY